VNFDNGTNEEDDDDDDNPSATVLRVLFSETQKTMIAILVWCVCINAHFFFGDVMGVVTDHLGSKNIRQDNHFILVLCGCVVTIHSLTHRCWHGTCPRVAHPLGATTNHCVCMMCVVVVVV